MVLEQETPLYINDGCEANCHDSTKEIFYCPFLKPILSEMMLSIYTNYNNLCYSSEFLNNDDKTCERISSVTPKSHQFFIVIA